MSSAGRHVVLGTGPLGRAVAHRLLDAGRSVRMINTSARMAEQPVGVELYGARLEKPERASELLRGAEVVYVCVGGPLERDLQAWPPLHASIVAAAEEHGTRLVFADNAFLYGDNGGAPVTPDSPAQATTRKGALRKRLDEQLSQAHARGRTAVTVARSSTFYGPWVRNSFLGERVFDRLVRGRAMQVLGDPRLPHSYTYIDDVARTMVVLGRDERALGRVWHVPTVAALPTLEVLHRAAALAGQPCRVSKAPRALLRIGGVFSAPTREIIELLYLVEKPFVFDSSRTTEYFGLHPTPLETGLRATIDWYRAASGGQQ